MKRAVERLISRSGFPRLGRHRYRSRALILAYHNVVPDDEPPEGDVSLHLARSAFAAQLDHLLRVCHVVPLSALLDEAIETAPRVAITFDDAYRGSLTLGLEELAARRLPATIFVAPGTLGDRALWWDELASPDGSGLPAEIRERALTELSGDASAIRAWADSSGFSFRELTPERRTATVEEIEAACSEPGITLGSHSWSHRNLTKLPRDELDRELGRSMDWLAQRSSAAIPWLSYPFGLSSEATEEAARAAGYDAAVRVNGGWIERPTPNPYRLPRLNIPSGLSLDGFALRLAGWFSR